MKKTKQDSNCARYIDMFGIEFTCVWSSFLRSYISCFIKAINFLKYLTRQVSSADYVLSPVIVGYFEENAIINPCLESLYMQVILMFKYTWNI